ncbi:DUF6468 domain-containing protein [Henriciella mobilis]|uniref:DUF6468 domain-containing protein n=1 Tax=Henriciella mobilis TaxID=2305467 RepID=A0A399RA57_9PROT|nr:DUF6468 domain-containing protein [Henriciella mobilis]RIJ18344.1 hypothetical protein D1231_03340 [Henriciella mobilis]RIJ24853.1 hypothetical protein D1227_00320 [Henriciella mobilis]RIJ26905.1 hypothetical protein D1223_18420 [Henriciella mobilis]
MDQMIVQPTDLALFLVSFAACIYCFILSRRLKALQDTRDGLGATIMALTKSVSAVSSATSETRSQAGELATRLSSLMKDADQMCHRLSALTDELEKTHKTASESATAAQGELKMALGDLLDQSQDSMTEMRRLLRQMRTLTGVAATTIRDSDFLFDDEDADLVERTL